MTALFGQHITFLPVSSLPKSSHFYGEVLGLELTLDQGDCHIYKVTETSFIGLCERTKPNVESRLLITLITDDVDGVHERLMKAGAKCSILPRHSPDYDIYQAMYKDPDGYTIETQQFLDESWPTNAPEAN